MTKTKSILIVDDDYITAKKLAARLMQDGHITYHAKNGKDGLIKAGIYIPEIIISEFILQDMAGLSFMRRIQADEDIKKAQLLIYTSHITYENRIESLKNGAVDFIQKTNNNDEIIIKLKYILNKERDAESNQSDYKRLINIKLNKDKDRDIITASERFISENLNRKIMIQDVARKIGVNRNKLSEALKNHKKTTIYGFVMKIRIDTAKKLLQDKSIPIQTISEVTGFGYAANFSTAFKKYTGISPKEFRDRIYRERYMRDYIAERKTENANWPEVK